MSTATLERTRVPVPRRGAVPGRRRRGPAVWPYVLPVCLVFCFVFVGPLLYTVWTAMHSTSYYTLEEFTGLDSFRQLFADGDLGGRVLTTLAFAFGALAVALPVGLGSAMVLDGIPRLKRTVRSLFLLPWLMSQATVGTIWLWFLNPNFGPATAITRRLGLGTTDVFSTPGAALVAITLITAWWSYPQAMLLFLGALQTIPVELRESMKVDGGNAWHGFRNITLPYIRNTIVSVMVVLLMLYVQMVTIVLVTTRGGPLGATETLAMRVYNQMFLEYDLSGASASALLLFAVNVALTLAAIRFRRKETL